MTEPGARTKLGEPQLSVLELLLTVIVGLVFFALKNHTVAIITWVVGTFLTAQRLALSLVMRQRIDPIASSVVSIAKFIDLRTKVGGTAIEGLFDAYFNITEKEFGRVKFEILDDALQKLNRLRNNKRSEELSTSAYYNWLLPMLSEMGEGNRIRAVSLMFDTEWDSSPQEQKFLDGNLNAARAGADVERVFIMPADMVSAALGNRAVKLHTVEERDKSGLRGLLVDSAGLAAEPQLTARIGNGFILFDSNFALVDNFDESGAVRGEVTMNKSDLIALENAYERLKVLSRPLSLGAGSCEGDAGSA